MKFIRIIDSEKNEEVFIPLHNVQYIKHGFSLENEVVVIYMNKDKFIIRDKDVIEEIMNLMQEKNKEKNTEVKTTWKLGLNSLIRKIRMR